MRKDSVVRGLPWQDTEGMNSMNEFQKTAKEMLDFIEKSPTCFHAAANIGAMLETAGFRKLRETEAWKPEKGGKYYTERNDSSVIAFVIPTGEIKGFHMAAAHSDSPCFKVKEKPELTVEEHYMRLNTEKYGGMILSTWLDRPLSVAGRLAVRDAEGIKTRLVNIDRDLCVIPNVAIHMNREMNRGVEYNPQVDMLPLFADAAFDVSETADGRPEKIALQKLAAEAAGVDKDAVLGEDLFLYTRQEGRFLGANGEFVLSPRLDDLQSAFALTKAFTESVPTEYINICAVFDNEEVGSGTRQGADSTFLADVLDRITEGLGADRSTYLRWVADSFLISADNAHAVHPNHPEKADPTNRPYLNGGIVIKYHGSQKYTTDGISAAKMKDYCERANVPWQTYANRSDIAGGSTLGNISTAHVSVSSVDIGLPQLAMHSAVETAGMKDTEYAVRALREFWKE